MYHQFICCPDIRDIVWQVYRCDRGCTEPDAGTHAVRGDARQGHGGIP